MIIIIYSLNIAPLDIKMIKSARGRSKIVLTVVIVGLISL